MDTDGEELLDSEGVTSGDGKQMADEEVSGVDEDSIKKLKEKGKQLQRRMRQCCIPWQSERQIRA